jgi:hypothetical protein
MKSKAGQPRPKPIIPEATMGHQMSTPAQFKGHPSVELCDLIYDDPLQSQGIGGPKYDPSQWHLEMVGGLPHYVKVPDAADLDFLREEMIALHPDKTMADTAAQFIEAHARYSEALLKSKE